MKAGLGFVGAGRWALALALNFNREGLPCALWEPDATALGRLQATGRHPDLPGDSGFPEELRLCASAPEALGDADIVVFAVPSGALAAVAETVRPLLGSTARTLVTVAKGIEPVSLRRLSVVLAEAIPGHPVVVLAGPGIPWDFALGDPTSLVAASELPAAADTVRDRLTVGNLRVYSSPDVVGVELGAALKNVIAIAAGIADGLGLGINAKAALLTRGLAEMTRLGLSFNANPMTFAGLSGMGDLVVTACSEKSRNHTLGRLVGSGVPPAEALAQLNGVAEGAAAVRPLLALAARNRVQMPISTEVDSLLYGNGSPRRSLRRLLGRPPRREDS